MGESQPSEQPLLERLAATPERIASAVASWDDARLRATPSTGEWSACGILAHLRASDDILAYRAYMMLARDNPPLPAFDERQWAEVAGYADLPFNDSLSTFTAKRAELVAMLRRNAPGCWARTGAHETRGTITLLDIITTLVEHEEEHCAQIEALAS